jgi:hypothetical protein
VVQIAITIGNLKTTTINRRCPKSQQVQSVECSNVAAVCSSHDRGWGASGTGLLWLNEAAPSHHAEGRVDPNTQYKKTVTGFEYPRACRFRKYQIENRSWELRQPTFFKT